MIRMSFNHKITGLGKDCGVRYLTKLHWSTTGIFCLYVNVGAHDMRCIGCTDTRPNLPSLHLLLWYIYFFGYTG